VAPAQQARIHGRGNELGTLQQALVSLQTKPRLLAFTVVAEAGLSKSRLLQAFSDACGANAGAQVRFRSRAVPGTQDQPFGLLRNMLASWCGWTHLDAPEATRARFEQTLLPHGGAPEGDDAAVAPVPGVNGKFPLAHVPCRSATQVGPAAHLPPTPCAWHRGKRRLAAAERTRRPLAVRLAAAHARASLFIAASRVGVARSGAGSSAMRKAASLWQAALLSSYVLPSIVNLALRLSAALSTFNSAVLRCWRSMTGFDWPVMANDNSPASWA
jgi:hypothetical protein